MIFRVVDFLYGDWHTGSHFIADLYACTGYVRHSRLTAIGVQHPSVVQTGRSARTSSYRVAQHGVWSTQGVFPFLKTGEAARCRPVTMQIVHLLPSRTPERHMTIFCRDVGLLDAMTLRWRCFDGKQGLDAFYCIAPSACLSLDKTDGG